MANQQNEKLIKIGVLAFRGTDKALSRWQKTAEYLSKELPAYHFKISPYDLPRLTRAVENNEVSFVLTNPGHYVLLESKYGLSRIVTLQRKFNGKINTRFGAVIFTRADNKEIYTIKDLKGKRFMAVSPDAFGGFQMSWLELNKQKINPFKDFSEMQFHGFPQDAIAMAVFNRKTDAATIRSETLVNMIEDGVFKQDDFRILNSQNNRGAALSTQLYPEWPFATSKNTPRALAKQVAQKLLAMPENHPAAISSRTAGWTVPLDYSQVHELMKTLSIEPYNIKPNTSIKYFIKKYVFWIISSVLFLMLLIAINTFVARTNRRLKVTEKKLRNEIQEREASQVELSKYKDSLEKRVADRTNELMSNNLSLQRSQKALHDLVDITIDTSLTHREKLTKLLDTGREYYQLPIAMLSSLVSENERICSVSNDQSINVKNLQPLSRDNAQSIIKKEDQPLDIPDIENNHSNMGCGGRSMLKSYLATAVFVKGEAHCILEFSGLSKRDKEYTQWDHNLLQVMGQWIGSEIEKQLAVDEKQKHRAELYRVSRINLMGEMAANIAHELNQPLTAACNYSSGCLRLLEDEEYGNEKVKAGLKKTIESASLAANIIRQQRTFLQKGDNQMQKVQLNELVKKLVELISTEINRKSIELKLELEQQLNSVYANSVQIEQVILNLIRNAIDSMKNKKQGSKELNIRTGQYKNTIRLSVIDTGSGIDEKNKGKLFNAFFTTKEDGMGMGLSISRSIVEAHDGVIGVNSLEPEGSCFYFELKTQK